MSATKVTQLSRDWVLSRTSKRKSQGGLSIVGHLFEHNAATASDVLSPAEQLGRNSPMLMLQTPMYSFKVSRLCRQREGF